MTSISSPVAGPGSLNYPNKKKEATRIDQENYKFAQRIMNQKPMVDQLNSLHSKHKKNMKTIHMISNTSGVSINRLVAKNSARF